MELKKIALKITAPIAIAFATIGMASAASAGCPDWQDPARAEIHGSAQQFYTRHSYNVVAGGDNNVEYCAVSRQTPERAVGYVAGQPDFEIYYDGLSNYALEISVSGQCDTTLLINTANQNWYFDDDDAGQGNPRIYLTNPSEGWYDVWVGTYGGNLCDAQLHLETF